MFSMFGDPTAASTVTAKSIARTSSTTRGTQFSIRTVVCRFSTFKLQKRKKSFSFVSTHVLEVYRYIMWNLNFCLWFKSEIFICLTWKIIWLMKVSDWEYIRHMIWEKVYENNKKIPPPIINPKNFLGLGGGQQIALVPSMNCSRQTQLNIRAMTVEKRIPNKKCAVSLRVKQLYKTIWKLKIPSALDFRLGSCYILCVEGYRFGCFFFKSKLLGYNLISKWWKLIAVERKSLFGGEILGEIWLPKKICAVAKWSIWRFGGCW